MPPISPIVNYLSPLFPTRPHELPPHLPDHRISDRGFWPYLPVGRARTVQAVDSAAPRTLQGQRKRSFTDVRAVISATYYEKSNTKASLALGQA